MPFVIAAIWKFFEWLFHAIILNFTLKKGMMLFLLTIVMPISLYNLYFEIQNTLLQWLTAKVGSITAQGYTVQIAGMGAWIAVQIDLANALSVYFTAVTTRFSLRFLGKFF